MEKDRKDKVAAPVEKADIPIIGPILAIWDRIFYSTRPLYQKILMILALVLVLIVLAFFKLVDVKFDLGSFSLRFGDTPAADVAQTLPPTAPAITPTEPEKPAEPPEIKIVGPKQNTTGFGAAITDDVRIAKPYQSLDEVEVLEQPSPYGPRFGGAK